MEAPAERRVRVATITADLSACVMPARTYLGCNDVLAALAGDEHARMKELASLPLGHVGQRLVALRYFIANGKAWLRHYNWADALERRGLHNQAHINALGDLVAASEERMRDVATAESAHAASMSLQDLGAAIERHADPNTDDLDVLVRFHLFPEHAAAWRSRLRAEEGALRGDARRAADLVYLATYDLTKLPATTASNGDLRYVIVADKGEMGVRAVREVVAIGATPVVVFSEVDDADALQVRLAKASGGLVIALEGNFRESYANPTQIAERVCDAYAEHFGDGAREALGRSVLYPGYGPLAENTAAIQLFRRAGIPFAGPTQDAVELAGDKRTFRSLAERIEPNAVTPGITIASNNAALILRAIHEGHQLKKFTLPGRLKAANGGGVRCQVVLSKLSCIESAVRTVLGQIAANGWDPGVMFEQNIAETTHLEVQIVRDRFGNARHFGMRDCTEQRSSQKIQEEAPPALLRDDPELAERCCGMAIELANAVGYVGACTVELMYKDGAVYLLEMNTRIQVEHPVTEQAHHIRTASGLQPLNLVQLQLAVAAGKALDFAQHDLVVTHVAREFRINAESWNPALKDSRDGGRGLFVPNAGVFDEMFVPAGDDVLMRLNDGGERRIDELHVRFDTGFEVGDTLVNKDPTFGKLIVSVKAKAEHHAVRYELLRIASIEVLKQTRIEGRQVMPSGDVIDDSTFKTNVSEHLQILHTSMLTEHSLGIAKGRHVNWVVGMLRGGK